MPTLQVHPPLRTCPLLPGHPRGVPRGSSLLLHMVTAARSRRGPCGSGLPSSRDLVPSLELLCFQTFVPCNFSPAACVCLLPQPEQLLVLEQGSYVHSTPRSLCPVTRTRPGGRCVSVTSLCQSRSAAGFPQGSSVEQFPLIQHRGQQSPALSAPPPCWVPGVASPVTLLP